MDNEKNQIIKETLSMVIPYLDSLPNGRFIPSSWQAPEGFVNEKLMVGQIPVEHLIPRNKKTNHVVLHIHGGGYLVALCDPYRDGAVKYSTMAGGAEVYSIDYRVTPTNHYPAALEDAVAVYKWLLEKGYDSKNMLVVGDSAGGNLTLSTILYLKDHEIPLPKAVIAISPWTNPANDFPSVKYNTEKDVILGKYGLKMGSEINNPVYFNTAKVKEDPYASPVLGDYKGFPNLLIQVGSYEVLLDDARNAAENAREAGVNVKFTIYDEMSHDFQLLIPALKESEAAWKEMQQFVEENM